MTFQIGVPVRSRLGVAPSAQDIQVANAVKAMDTGNRLPITFTSREDLEASTPGILAALRSVLPKDVRKSGDFSVRLSSPKDGTILYISKNAGWVDRPGRPRKVAEEGAPTKRVVVTPAAPAAAAAPTAKAPASAGKARP